MIAVTDTAAAPSFDPHQTKSERAMALIHAQPLEVIDLNASDAALGTSISSSLLKTPHLQLMRVVLAAGHALPEHVTRIALTIQLMPQVLRAPLRETSQTPSCQNSFQLALRSVDRRPNCLAN
jgi:hypothetical protein